MSVTLAKWVTSVMLVIAGIIHLLPLGGFMSSQRLQTMYGITAPDANLEILLRHRAILFGLLGAYLVLAAFRPASQPNAFAAGFISVSTFLWLAYTVGSYNTQIARVVSADVVALACLGIGAITYLLQVQD